MQSNEWVECTDCEGRGYFERYQEREKVSCQTCAGWGEVPVCHEPMHWSEPKQAFACGCGHIRRDL